MSRTIRQRIAADVASAPDSVTLLINLHSADLADAELYSPTSPLAAHGNRIVLDTYAAVLGDQAGEHHRWRVEHAQVIAMEDFPRFATLKLIASMQPTHATSDMPWAEARIESGYTSTTSCE